jgi:BMFP domain-containing protein YqiC
MLPGITRPWHHHYRWCSMETKRAASIYPTVEEINALPENFRQYIHDLVTRCDKSGDGQTIAILREDRDALQRRVEELEARIAQQEREYPAAPVETN